MQIAIASGKGGTGKTTIATNLAAAVAAGQRPVAYVDCDVEEPNGHLFLKPQQEEKTTVNVSVPTADAQQCTMCGICADICQFNAIAMVGQAPMIFASLCHSCGACIELCPEDALHEVPREIGFIRRGTADTVTVLGGSLNVGESQAPPVTRELRKLLPGLQPEAQVVIIDAPPGTSCPVIEAVRDTDYVVLVTEPTPFGLNDLALACEMLRELRIPFGVVINRSDTGNDDVRAFCQRERVPILLELPFDRALAETYAIGGLAAASSAGFRRRMQTLYTAIENAAEQKRP